MLPSISILQGSESFKKTSGNPGKRPVFEKIDGWKGGEVGVGTGAGGGNLVKINVFWGGGGEGGGLS